MKKIHHLVLQFPYLIQILEEFVFEPHNISKSTIKKIVTDIYSIGIKRNLYEPCSYALFWALKYNFKLDNIKTIKAESLKSNDCIFMLIAYLYDKKNKPKKYLKEYKAKATKLNTEDFDRYWLFIYEVLAAGNLKFEYREMKKKGVSFVLSKFN